MKKNNNNDKQKKMNETGIQSVTKCNFILFLINVIFFFQSFFREKLKALAYRII